MKKSALSILISLIICLTASSQNKSLPSVNVKTLKGKKVNIQSIENDGFPIVLSFWATWCKPCKKELNAIAEVYEEWQEETGVKLIAISIDDTRGVNKVAPEVNSAGWEYDILLDTNRDLARALGITTVPHTFLLDENLNIVWDHKGYIDGDEEELYDQIHSISKK